VARAEKNKLAELTKRYAAGFKVLPPDNRGNYELDHALSFWIFDTKHQAKLLGQSNQPLQEMVDDLNELIK
jgi:hypothetical protein